MMPSVRPTVLRTFPGAVPIVQFSAYETLDKFAIWDEASRRVGPWRETIEGAYKAVYNLLPQSQRLL